MNELLDPVEAGRHIGGTQPVSPHTLSNWRIQGSGPTYVRVGGAVRYRRTDLDAWLTAQTRTPNRAA